MLELVYALLLVEGLLHLRQGGLGLCHRLVGALSDLTFVPAVLHAVRGGRISVSSGSAALGRFLLGVYGLFPVAVGRFLDPVDGVRRRLDRGDPRRARMQSAPSLVLVVVNGSDDALLFGAGALRAGEVEIELAQRLLFAHHAAGLVLRCVLGAIEGLFHTLVEPTLVLERLGMLLQNGCIRIGQKIKNEGNFLLTFGRDSSILGALRLVQELLRNHGRRPGFGLSSSDGIEQRADLLRARRHHSLTRDLRPVFSAVLFEP